MYPRICADRLAQLARQFPAVLILGARQVGKTTLARQAFPGYSYLDLEDAATHALFAEDRMRSINPAPCFKGSDVIGAGSVCAVAQPGGSAMFQGSRAS